MATLDVVEDSSGVTVRIVVKPRAARSRVGDVVDGALSVWVKAPPVDGAANLEMLRVLARHLGAPKSALSLVGGHRGRRKRVRIEGLDRRTLLASLSE